MKKNMLLTAFTAFLFISILGGSECPANTETGSHPKNDGLRDSKQRLMWVGCDITKKAFMVELAKAYEKKTGISVDILGGGATRGIREVASGSADIGGSCRHAMEVLEEKEVVLMPVAWDALAVVTHKDNPISNISTNQLHDLMSGKITNWAALGAPDDYGKINLHVRKGKISGVGFMARLLIFQDQEMKYRGAVVHKSSGPLEKAIEHDLLGIGLTGLSSAVRSNLKIISLNNSLPTAANIMDGTYKLVRPLYLVVPKSQKEKGSATDFVRFALSKEGQQIIADTGTVPIIEISDELTEINYKIMEQARQAVKRLRSDRAAMEKFFDMTLMELLTIEVNDRVKKND